MLELLERGKEEMSRQGIRVLSAMGLIFGVGASFLGLTTTCNCPAQLVGQPLDCSCAQSASLDVIIGVSVIIVSAIVLAFSFLKPSQHPKVRL